jgi:hypothetical protein
MHTNTYVKADADTHNYKHTQVEIPIAMLAIEAIHDSWYSLEPRNGHNDIVSGQLHLVITVNLKQQVLDDNVMFVLFGKKVDYFLGVCVYVFIETASFG